MSNLEAMDLSTEVGDSIDHASGILKSRDHNGRTVICRLPPETLAHVFLVNTIAERDSLKVVFQSTLFACIHVCSYWREVAFGCTHLWTHINTLDCAHRPEWTKFLL